jgi:tetratricopeptide (TPR) repeat protein
MRWVKQGVFIAAFVALSGSARAQDPSARELASREFQRGLTLAKSGDLSAAVVAFETAHRASPHHTVLYNLGQAYSGLGKPVEAVNALERYLRDGGESIAPDRRREVEQLVARERQRIGYVELALSPPDADVFVDGLAVRASSGKLALAAGQHVIAVRKAGHASRVEAVNVGAGQTVRLGIDLEQTAAAVGQLVIACETPGVAVSVDGAIRGVTPLELPLLVPPGNRAIRFARDGYRTVDRTVTAAESKPARLVCPMTVDLSGVRPGRLNIAVGDPYARVSVNGVGYEGALLPPGPHLVRVERAGYRTWTQSVSLAPGARQSVDALLVPTPEHFAELDAERRRRRNFALGIGAGGVVLVGVSVGAFIWNSNRYDDLRADIDRADAGDPSPSEHGELRDRATDIQRADDIATVTAAVGVTALISAAVLWLTSGGETPPTPPSAKARSGRRDP